MESWRCMLSGVFSPSWSRASMAPMAAGKLCSAILPITSRAGMSKDRTLKMPRMTADIATATAMATKASAMSSRRLALVLKPLTTDRPTSSGISRTSSSTSRQGVMVKPIHHISIVISIGREKISAPAKARASPTRKDRWSS